MKRGNYLTLVKTPKSWLLLFCLATLLFATAGGGAQTRWTYGSGGIVFNTPAEACKALVAETQGQGYQSKIKDNPNPELKDCYYLDKNNNNQEYYVAFVYIVTSPDATPTPEPTATPSPTTSPTPEPTPPPPPPSQTPAATPPPDPFALIAMFRERNKIPRLAEDCATGTVAYIRAGGREVYGLNTSLERQYLGGRDNEGIRRLALEEIQRQLRKLPGETYAGAGQFLTHAEAEALIKARRGVGPLPKRLTLYVDRRTCNMCGGGMEDGLPLLAELYDIRELTVIDSGGRTLLVRPGQRTTQVNPGRVPCGS